MAFCVGKTTEAMLIFIVFLNFFGEPQTIDLNRRKPSQYELNHKLQYQFIEPLVVS